MMFVIKDKERSGRPKVYEHAESKELLDQDLCQTQEEQCLEQSIINRPLAVVLNNVLALSGDDLD